MTRMAQTKPHQGTPLDSVYVRRIAATIDDALAPGIKFSVQREKESLAQLVALILVVEKRMGNLGLTRDDRMKTVGAAVAILGEVASAEVGARVDLGSREKLEEALAIVVERTKLPAPPAKKG